MKLLIPIDYSLYSNNAFDYGVNLAMELNAELDLVHAYRGIPLEDSINRMSWEENDRKRKEAELKKFDTFIQAKKKLMPEVKWDDINVSFKAIEGPVLRVIKSVIDQNDYKFIIMGSHGADITNKEDLFGSVTDNVIDVSKAPVFAIPLEANYKTPGSILLAEDLATDDFEALRPVLDLSDRLDAMLNVLHLSEASDYENPEKSTNYQNLKYVYTRENRRVNFFFESSYTSKLDAVEKKSHALSTDIVAIVRRNSPNDKWGHQAKNLFTKACIERMDVPVLALNNQEAKDSA